MKIIIGKAYTQELCTKDPPSGPRALAGDATNAAPT